MYIGYYKLGRDLHHYHCYSEPWLIWYSTASDLPGYLETTSARMINSSAFDVKLSRCREFYLREIPTVIDVPCTEKLHWNYPYSLLNNTYIYESVGDLERPLWSCSAVTAWKLLCRFSSAVSVYADQARQMTCSSTILPLQLRLDAH